MRRIVCWLRGHVWVEQSQVAKFWALDQRLSWPRWCRRCVKVELHR